MSQKNSFLPQHPKIFKKVPSNKNSPQITSRSKYIQASSVSYSDQSISGEENQKIMDEILFKQAQLVEDLQDQVKDAVHKNQLVSESLKYFDTHREQKEITEQIQSTQQELASIIEKIKNCEKIEKSTTPQQYYLWQKKKKTDYYQQKIQVAHDNCREERQRLKNICIDYGKAVDQAKQEIKHVAEQITKLQIGIFSDDEQAEQIDQVKLAKLKQQYQQLRSTVSLMRQDNQIMKTQFKDTAEETYHSLEKSFENNKSSLIKDLYALKVEIEDKQAEPPLPADKDSKVQETIEDYENKIKQKNQQIDQQIVQKKPELFQPFNWRDVKLENYLGEQNNQFDIYYEKYQTYTKQLEEVQEEITKYDNQLRILINQAVEYQQKNNEIEHALSRAYRNSTTTHR